MFGLWRYGFRDGGGLSALRSADGKTVPEMREYKYRTDFRFEERCKCLYVWYLRGQYDKE